MPVHRHLHDKLGRCTRFVRSSTHGGMVAAHDSRTSSRHRGISTRLAAGTAAVGSSRGCRARKDDVAPDCTGGCCCPRIVGLSFSAVLRRRPAAVAGVNSTNSGPARARGTTIRRLTICFCERSISASGLLTRTTNASLRSSSRQSRETPILPRRTGNWPLPTSHAWRMSPPMRAGSWKKRLSPWRTRALSIDPNAPEGYIARGDLLWTRSHRFAHESAVQQFRHALALNPGSDETHRRLARVFVHVGFFDEAIHHADTALTLNPSNAQALNSRAQALLWMGKDEEALAILSRVPGPVLPELVDANIVFAMFRLEPATGRVELPQTGETAGTSPISAARSLGWKPCCWPTPTRPQHRS